MIPDGSPIFVNTRFLPWQNFTGAAPLPPPPPGFGGSYKELPQCYAISVFVGPSKLHSDVPTTIAARAICSLTFLLTHQCWFRLMSRWYTLGLFSAPLADEDALLQKMKQVYQPVATRLSAARLQPWLASMRGIVPWAALGASWTAPGVAVVSRCPARRPPASLEQIQGGIEDGRRGRPSKCGTAAPPHRSKTANGSCPYEDRPGTDGRRPLASKPGAARPWASGFQVQWGSARRCSRGRSVLLPVRRD